jgi:hypothetical protein
MRSEANSNILVEGRIMKSPSILTTGREVLAARRHQRTARRHLARELAEFRTPAERLELDAMLDRYPAEATWELRRILAVKAVSLESAQRQERWPYAS